MGGKGYGQSSAKGVAIAGTNRGEEGKTVSDSRIRSDHGERKGKYLSQRQQPEQSPIQRDLPLVNATELRTSRATTKLLPLHGLLRTDYRARGQGGASKCLSHKLPGEAHTGLQTSLCRARRHS